MKLDENTKKKIAEKIIKKLNGSGVRFTGITDESIENAWKSILRPIKDALDEVEIEREDKELYQLLKNIQDEKGLVFRVTDELFDRLSCWTELVYKCEDNGYRLDFGKTPKGTKRVMIVPTAEKLHEIEQQEKELGFEE